MEQYGAGRNALSEANGINIREVGKNEPAIIFVHGFGCDLSDWEAQIEALSADFKCVALDLPGHGASAMPSEPTIAAMAEAVNVAKEKSGARKAVVVGHSLGAKVIREAFSQSKENVAGLMMIDGRLVPGDPEAVLREIEETLDAMGFDAFIKDNFGQMILDSNAALYRERFIKRALKLGPQFGKALFVNAMVWDPLRSEQTLRDITVPLVVIQSTYADESGARLCMEPDVRTPLIDKVEELVPGAEIKVVTGAGHFTMLDAAETVTQEIRRLAERVR